MSLVSLQTRAITQLDRAVIRTNWRRINETPMKRAGLMVRRIARGSIRRRSASKPKAKRKPSPGGQAPRSWVDSKTPPMKMIFNQALSMADLAQIVGMVGFGGQGTPVPQLHEEGGTVRRRVFMLGAQRRTKKGRFGKRVSVPVFKTVHYEPRPFMNPALQKAAPKLPFLWRNSIRSTTA